jgi:hypothetical protein
MENSIEKQKIKLRSNTCKRISSILFHGNDDNDVQTVDNTTKLKNKK